jgi:hypothetical protein
VPESGPLGSVRGAASNGRSYRETHRTRVVKKLDVVETRGENLPWDKSVRRLITGQTATGVERA